MTPPLPAGTRSRPAAFEDLDAVVELFETYDAQVVGDVEPRREFLSWIWRVPYVDLARDAVLVHDGDDPVGFAQTLRNADQGGPFQGLGVVHPDHRGRGIGNWLLDSMETVRDGVESGEGVRVAIPAKDEVARDLLTVRGYRMTRTSWDMTTLLDGEWPTAEPPDGVSFRTFVTGQDERRFWEVEEGAFADSWDHRDTPFESYAAAMYDADDWDPSLAVLAEIDGEPVAESFAIEFASMGYVGSLGVLPAHRGRGIARALLARAFAELAARGQTVVELTVDAQNPTGAVRLYEGMGMGVRRETHIYDLGASG